MPVLQLFWLSLGLLLFAPLGHAQSLKAYLDRSTVYEGETVILTLEIQGAFPEMDPSPLTEAFHIRNASSGTEFTVVNAKQTLKSTRVYQLEPKRTGQIEVPRFRIGAEMLPLLRLTVLPLSEAPENDRDDVFLETLAEPENPYVQAQIRYVERLFIALPVSDLGYHVAGVENAVVEPLGEYRQYQATRNGKRYTVLEFRYAIFPEKSGKLTIPATRFEMRTRADSGRSMGSILNFNRGRRIEVVNKPLELEVRPRPSDYSGQYWLPSSELSLTESWPEQTPEFRVGEPVTRTLVLEAHGLSASQLPELRLQQPEGINRYPDQPLTENRISATGLIGRREQSVALVPTQTGELVLPEIRLVWWNTELDAEQVAVLPARTIQVLPATGLIEPGAGPQPTAEPAIAADSESLASDQPLWRPSRWLEDLENQGYWLTSLGLLTLWLLTLLAWWRERRRNRVLVTPTVNADSQRRQEAAQAAWRSLRQACKQGDATAAAGALLHLAAIRWPERPPRSLGALAARLETAAGPLQALDQALYAPNKADWSGQTLWQAMHKAFAKTAVQADQHKDKDDWPALYPERA